jgi:nitroreductase
MELIEALRTTGSVRRFTDRPVGDELLFSVLDDARFAPSGGNRQAWRVIVDYVGHVMAGLVPFSPLASEQDRARALAHRDAAAAQSERSGFAESLDEVPVMLVVCADLEALAATDRDLGRYQIAGGASIYPFAWSILLAARERELAGVMTTVAIRKEPEIRAVLDIPDTYAVASIIALGYPEQRPSKLTRRRVEEFTTVDTFDGTSFSAH